ncbi:Hypothetical_protein [Hexamita inflata]|uniref:Hypothetical_protein n=1 Tax=Hexamita inflata TaxID=28002 RepID=A0AA86U006_9EUKA|nr:Hypothetical protein HINF_LOCUS22634 [Hexamita inflata]
MIYNQRGKMECQFHDDINKTSKVSCKQSANQHFQRNPSQNKRLCTTPTLLKECQETASAVTNAKASQAANAAARSASATKRSHAAADASAESEWFHIIYCLALGAFHERASSEMYADDGHDNQRSVELQFWSIHICFFVSLQIQLSTNTFYTKYQVSRMAFTTARAKLDENECIY